MSLTARHAHLMRHALGCSHSKPIPATISDCYRNHFCAADADMPAWDELVAAGLAAARAPSELSGGSVTYQVTRAGFAALQLTPEGGAS